MKNLFKKSMVVMAMVMAAAICFNVATVQAGEICTDTDYWVVTSDGTWVHIKFTTCIEEEMAEVSPD